MMWNLSLSVLGCYVGNYTQTFTDLTSTSISSFSQALTNITGITATITDYATCPNPYNCVMNGLVGYWHSDETSGTLIEDFSGNGNNGTWSGSAVINTSTGKYNNGGYYDGVNDYVDAGAGNSINITSGDLTVMAWFYSRNLTAAGIVGTRTSKNDNTLPYEIRMFGGKFEFTMSNGTGQRKVIYPTIPLQAQWYHLVGVLNGSDMILYVNLDPATGTFSGTRQWLSKLTIGARGSTVGFVNGTIDEIRIYNRSLNITEIQSLYYSNLQELQIKTNANSTYSGFNNASSNVVTVPSLNTESISSLSYQLPSSVYNTAGSVFIYDYINTTKWNISVRAGYTENTTTITDTCTSGNCQMNISILHAVSGIGNITVNLNSSWVSAATKQNAVLNTTNTNAVVTTGTTTATIYEGSVDNTTTYLYNLTYTYNVSVSTNFSAPTPTDLITTQNGNWFNYTWVVGSGNVTDSYNITHNNTWTNGSTYPAFNVTVAVGNWSNITIYAFNATGTGTLSNTLSSNVNNIGTVLNLISTWVWYDKANVTWDSIAGANYYDLYRDNVHLVYTNNTKYDDSGLDGINHQYFVRANNSLGTWGSNSSLLNVTLPIRTGGGSGGYGGGNVWIAPKPNFTNTTKAVLNATKEIVGNVVNGGTHIQNSIRKPNNLGFAVGIVFLVLALVISNRSKEYRFNRKR